MQPAEDIRHIGEVSDNHSPSLFERLFGPSNETVLQRLAEQWGRPVTDGGLLGNDSLTFNYRGFKCAIVAESEYNAGTRCTTRCIDFIADYRPADEFQLRIENEGILSGLSKLFGTTDFEIGDQDYDRAFLLDSNNNQRLKDICDKCGIKGAMLQAGSCELTTQDPGWLSNIPEGMRRLRYRIEGEIEKVTALNLQLQAFGDILDGLVETGCVKQV